MSVRIGIDARALVYPGTGNARYLDGMLRELVRLRPDFEWQLFSHRPLHADFLWLARVPSVGIHAAASGLFRLGPFWVHLVLPGLVRRHECNLFWSALTMLPLFARRRLGIPRVVNVHDMNVFVAPETMEAWVKVQQRLLTGHIISQADRILCLSETTRADLLRFFPKTEKSRAVVVYPGCELPATESRAPKEPLEPGFLLAVGTIEPRKNFRVLVDAYLRARAEDENLPPLVILGRRGWGPGDLHDELSSGRLVGRGVRFLENQPDAVLSWCYENASLVLCPSLHEGFGLPVIEALQRGRPVLLSDIAIFREIAPDATFVEPRNAEAWARAIQSGVRAARAGVLTIPRFQAEDWTYRRRAGELLAVLEELL